MSADVLSGKRELTAVPERRPADPAQRRQNIAPAPQLPATGSTIRLWRCRVCGYLCARERPPLECPVCKAKQDRFEAFALLSSSAPTPQSSGA